MMKFNYQTLIEILFESLTSKSFKLKKTNDFEEKYYEDTITIEQFLKTINLIHNIQYEDAISIR